MRRDSMALPIPPINPNTRIPNDPFYYPEEYYINGPYGPLIIGSGLPIDFSSSTISATGGGGGAVNQIIAGLGVNVSPGSGVGNVTVSLPDTGITPGSYTNTSFTVNSRGVITAVSSGPTPVTSVSGTAPITVTGTTARVVSITAASTTTSGAVQLYDGTNSTSTALALTAAQGKSLQDQINALVVSGTVGLAGTLDASTGLVDSVTSSGAAKGFAVGATLPVASATTNNSYVIVTEPGTVTPPGGTPTAVTQGDWFLVSEVSPGVYQWTFLNVGFDAPAATTTVAGIACLSTNALAQAGTDISTALTPAAAASAYIPKACVTAKGTLITGTAASTPFALPVGTDGQVLSACAACPTGLTWATGGSGGAGDTPIGAINWFAGTAAPAGWLIADGRAISRTSYSDLFTAIGTTYGSGDGSTTFNLPDLRGQFIRGWDSAGGSTRGCDLGRVFGSSQEDMIQCHQHLMAWGEQGGGSFGRTTTAGKLGSASTDSDNFWFNTNDGTNYDGVLNPPGLIGCETRPMNVAMLPCIKYLPTYAPATPSACGIPCACITGKGAILTGTAANAPTALPVGANGQVLTANSACSLGVEWASAIPYPTAWVSAGTIQSVGIATVYGNGSAGIPPTIGSSVANNIRYRQLGAKEWEVQATFLSTSTPGSTGGDGYYVLTLPGGLQFDLTSPYQLPYTTVPDDGLAWLSYGLINSYARASQPGASTYQQSSILPYNATKYRIMFVGPSTEFWRGGYYQFGNYTQGFKWGFTFFTP